MSLPSEGKQIIAGRSFRKHIQRGRESRGNILRGVGWPESPERKNRFERNELTIPMRLLKPNRGRAKVLSDLVNVCARKAEEQGEPVVPSKPKIGRANSVVNLAKPHTKRSIQNIRQILSPTESEAQRPETKGQLHPAEHETYNDVELWNIFKNRFPSCVNSAEYLCYDEDASCVVKDGSDFDISDEFDMEFGTNNTRKGGHKDTINNRSYNMNGQVSADLEDTCRESNIHVTTPLNSPIRTSSVTTTIEHHISPHHFRDSPSTPLFLRNPHWRKALTDSPDTLGFATSTSSTITCNHATPSSNTNRRGTTALYEGLHAQYMGGNIANHIALLSHTGLNWQRALRGVLTSPYLSPEILDMVQVRLVHTNLRDTNGVVDPLAVSHPKDVGLVPNFSYPIAAAAFYDREIDDDGEDGEDDDDDRSSTYSFHGVETLANGTIQGSEKVDRLTNGVHYHIPLEPRTGTPTYSPPTPSSTHSQPPRGRQTDQFSFDSHIHPTQVIQVQRMQRELKGLQKRNKELEETMPRLLHKIDNQSLTTSYNLNTIDALREEVIDLKIALDYGNKALGSCWTREWSLMQTIKHTRDNMSKQRTGKRDTLRRNLLRLPWTKKAYQSSSLQTSKLPEGYEWEIFGHGPDPPGSANVRAHLRNHSSDSQHSPCSQSGRRADSTSSISKPEVDIFASMAEHNLRMLQDGIHEMLRLVQGCKNRVTFTGIQEVRTPPLGSWRDV